VGIGMQKVIDVLFVAGFVVWCGSVVWCGVWWMGAVKALP
jgi:hypothetical protein